MAKKTGLGRGLGALIKEVPPTAEPEAAAQGERLRMVPVSKIRKNPWQPRRAFDPEALEELVHSVREQGVLQPLLVRLMKDEYELIAGERRLRAATAAELTEVPVVITDATDREVLEIALIENLQRQDLNPVEEAEGYRELLNKFEMTQEQVAQRVGKSRAAVANSLRILRLPESILRELAAGRLSEGHAKILAGVEIDEEKELLAQRIINDQLSVRALEGLIRRSHRAPRKPRAEKADIPPAHLRDMSERLQHRLGTEVLVQSSKTLSNGKKAKGQILIAYYSADDLDRLMDVLGLSDEV